MHKHVARFNLAWLKRARQKWHFIRKAEDIRMIRALLEAERRMDAIRVTLDEWRRSNGLR